MSTEGEIGFSRIPSQKNIAAEISFSEISDRISISPDGTSATYKMENGKNFNISFLNKSNNKIAYTKNEWIEILTDFGDIASKIITEANKKIGSEDCKKITTNLEDGKTVWEGRKITNISGKKETQDIKEELEDEDMIKGYKKLLPLFRETLAFRIGLDETSQKLKEYEPDKYKKELEDSRVRLFEELYPDSREEAIRQIEKRRDKIFKNLEGKGSATAAPITSNDSQDIPPDVKKPKTIDQIFGALNMFNTRKLIPSHINPAKELLKEANKFKESNLDEEKMSDLIAKTGLLEANIETTENLLVFAESLREQLNNAKNTAAARNALSKLYDFLIKNPDLAKKSDVKYTSEGIHLLFNSLKSLNPNDYYSLENIQRAEKKIYDFHKVTKSTIPFDSLITNFETALHEKLEEVIREVLKGLSLEWKNDDDKFSLVRLTFLIQNQHRPEKFSADIYANFFDRGLEIIPKTQNVDKIGCLDVLNEIRKFLEDQNFYKDDTLEQRFLDLTHHLQNPHL